jgi:phosphopantothenoylcysteine decarboxylase/phosphopantothenate--cysteine ligase
MTASEASTPLADRAVIVAVTGGIAAYKSCALVSRLAQAGATVTVLMTEAATRFVTPLTFEALSGRPVHTSLWTQVEAHDSQHIALARNADLMIIAPATAHTIGRLAHGLCDDVVTTVACALPRGESPTPVLLAPSMNADMWANPLVQRNLETLREVLGYEIIGPETGWQACRTHGAGRMSDPETIYESALRRVQGQGEKGPRAEGQGPDG